MQNLIQIVYPKPQTLPEKSAFGCTYGAMWSPSAVQSDGIINSYFKLVYGTRIILNLDI